tara:strand:- start:398 stop:1036 length:639 start_codon:yes stop_codon:yes gene_type:complete
MLLNNQIIEVNRGEIVFSQENFAKRNGMSRQQLRTFLKKLKQTNMIKSSPNSNQQITHLFIVEYNSYNSIKNNQDLTNTQPRLNHIIRKKESKKVRNNKDFDLFWDHYPKKVGKKKVQDKFNSNNYPIDLIIKNIELQKKSDQWQNQQYIPNPETYLNQERWTDEVVLPVADDEPIYIYQCRKCKKTKTTSEYRDLYVSCCDEQVQPRKEYK